MKTSYDLLDSFMVVRRWNANCCEDDHNGEDYADDGNIYSEATVLPDDRGYGRLNMYVCMYVCASAFSHS